MTSIALTYLRGYSDMRVIDDIRDFLDRPSRYARAIEYALGLFTIAWGLRLALPPDVFSTSVSWSDLRQSPAPEWAWGTVIALLGLVKIVAARKRWLAIRRQGAFIGMALWSGIALSFALLNGDSPGWTPYLFYAALNLLTFLRLGLRGAQ